MNINCTSKKCHQFPCCVMFLTTCQQSVSQYMMSITFLSLSFSYQTLQQACRPGDDDHQLLDELCDKGNLHTL